ncbi:MAG: phosphoenolpyruvate--protein phosphotransferase [Treponema sp.]|jgi:phosphotransferase system enzyme I (PtsI)|nr:phosphoenolpyruvate--protein phosphotransferase [Treponema sp.]
MKEFSGKTVFPGVAFGKLCLLLKPDLGVDTSPAADPDAEKKAFRSAIQTANRELSALFEKTSEEIGEDEAMIVDVQRMMLQDEDYIEAVDAFIRDDLNKAAYAVDRAGRQFFDMFSALDDPYMKARASDIADISRRLTAILLNESTVFSLSGPSVVIADDLTPSDTLTLDKKLIRAFVTRKGSTNSHTAILARILKIPSIVQAGVPLEKAFDGKNAAVDGHRGKLYVEPDEETMLRLEERQKNDEAEEAALDAFRGLPTVTKDGKKVELAANIGSVEDLESALANDAEGIGLFRSEFLYLGRTNYPDEEEQFESYRKVAEAMNGRRVIIRTLDIGADKQAAYLDLEKEENPALGLRAIRLCFERPEMFVTQLRAIYRASAYGKIAVMFPMIASLWELRRCKETAAEVREELVKKGVPVGDVELGIMVETPAAAICADELAREADFFSVGTNDLTQYTLAIDRQNARLERFLDTHHPALRKLLAMIAESAHKAGIWAGICGELAADSQMTKTLLSMGYDELSMSPGFILGMRKRIREMDLSRERAEKRQE